MCMQYVIFLARVVRSVAVYAVSDVCYVTGANSAASTCVCVGVRVCVQCVRVCKGSNYLKLTTTTACSPMILAPCLVHCGMW